MTKILAIETATEACSAAVLIDNNVYSRFKIAPREHTKLILSMMDDVLGEAGLPLKDIDAIAFSRGPGAFTGLRIAAGIAQGTALSVDKPVIPISTLACLALQVVDEKAVNNEKIIATLDARMGEIYWGIFEYQKGNIVLVNQEQVTKPEEIIEQLQSKYKDTPLVAIGTGWNAYKNVLEKNMLSSLRFIEKQYPSAKNIAKLAEYDYQQGKTVPPEEAQPVYIRNKVAKKPNVSV